MSPQTEPMSNVSAFLAGAGEGRTLQYRKKQIIFAQGDFADAMYYIKKGKVKLTTVSNRGKEGVLAILSAGAFFGEGCLAAQRGRIATATALTACSLLRIERSAAIRAIQNELTFSRTFVSYLLSRHLRVEEDLIDQLFNSSEKRLARTLLLLTNAEGETPEAALPRISQETLAGMVGTTRSRISFFMNKFKKQGFIDYKNGLKVNRALADVLASES